MPEHQHEHPAPTRPVFAYLMLEGDEDSSAHWTRKWVRVQFTLRGLLAIVVLCAVLFALPRQPFFMTILIFATLVTTCAVRGPWKDTTSIVSHDALAGFAVGMAVAAAALALSVTSDERAAGAAIGLFTGPILGCLWGVGLAIYRRSR